MQCKLSDGESDAVESECAAIETGRG